MDSIISLCVRCGQERIKGKESTYLIGATKTKLTVYICADKECQKVVEAEIKSKEERRLALIQKRIDNSAKKNSK
jgi:hypothetical protein